MTQGQTESLPAGRAIVTGPMAVVDRGKRLVWASYHDGADPRRLSAGQQVDRVVNLAARVRELLAQLSLG
jgi:hypothetical protein